MGREVLKPHALEERVYRMRRVEGWSMVIPFRKRCAIVTLGTVHNSYPSSQSRTLISLSMDPQRIIPSSNPPVSSNTVRRIAPHAQGSIGTARGAAGWSCNHFELRS